MLLLLGLTALNIYVQQKNEQYRRNSGVRAARIISTQLLNTRIYYSDRVLQQLATPPPLPVEEELDGDGAEPVEVEGGSEALEASPPEREEAQEAAAQEQARIDDHLNPWASTFDGDGVLPAPMSMIHELSRRMEGSGEEVSFRLYSDKPISEYDSWTPDIFSRRAMDAFIHGGRTDPLVRTERTGTGEVIRMALPDRMVADSCVACHNTHPMSPKTDWERGDVAGVFEVTLSTERARLSQLSHQRSLLMLSLGLAAILMLPVLSLAEKELDLRHRIDTLLWAVKRINDGDLETPISDPRRDNLGNLSREMESFVEHFKETVRQARITCGNLALASDDLLNFTQDVQQHLNTTNNVVQVMSSTSMEIGARSKIVSNSTHLAAAITSKVVDSTTLATRAAERSVTLGKEAKKIASQLHGNTLKIDSVLEQIDAIAKKTNLLAINATIEAAHSSDEHSGFTQVAEEIRLLAKSTKRAIDDIGELVTYIRDSSGATQRFFEKIEVEVQQIGRLQTTITETLSAQVRSTKTAHAISEENAGASSTISERADAVDASTNATAASTRKIAQTAQDLSFQAAELNEMLRRLTKAWENEA